MSYGVEFVAALGVACVAVGILIGVAIMVCYRRMVCMVSHSQEPRNNDYFHHDSRRNSNYNWSQNLANYPSNQSVQRFPVSASVVNENPSGTRLVSSNDEQRMRVHRVRANSEPGHSPPRFGINDVNKKTRQISCDPQQGNSRTGRSIFQVNESVNHGYDEEVPFHGMNNQELENHSANGTNIKEAGAKSIPNLGMSLVPSQALPTGNVGEHSERQNDSDDINEETIVKMLAYCPDDIRTIFKTCESSRTIYLREKKIVYICRMVDDKGGLLELENMGISLYVPPAAVPFNQRSLVTLVLNWDLNDNPFMEKKEALVSPVVYCGPHGNTFEKPCILKFKHCAFDTRYARVLTSQTDLFENKNWQDLNPVVSDCSDAGVDEDVSCCQTGVSLGVNECQVEVPHFSLFTCVMRSKHQYLKKWIQVAVFTHDIGPERKHQEIRVYFLNKTPCALQWAIQNEEQYNFSLACPDTTFLFTEAGENMMIHLSYVSEGWKAVDQEPQEPHRSVFFEQIWHGACPHASMCFKKIDNRRKSSNISAVEIEAGGSTNSTYHFGDSGKSTTASSETSKGMMNEIECSEINIALSLSQELCENNLSVPLNVLAHNLKLKIADTQVKVIDEGPS